MFTGGAGDDTFTANNAALGLLDSIDGGAGTDTLTVTDSVNIPLANIKAANIETINVTSTTGSVGAVAADAKVATKEKVLFTFNTTGFDTNVGTGPVAVTVGGATKTVGTSAVAQNLADLVTAINELAGSTIASTASANAVGEITVTAATAGTALPVITFANGTFRAQGLASTAADTAANTTIDVTAATNYTFKQTLQANQAAAAAVDSSTFSVPTGATKVAISAATTSNVASVATAETTVTGTAVTLSGGLTQTVTASDSVRLSGSTGAVVATISAAPSTSIAASSTSGWSAGAGAFVTGGSSVSITEAVGTASSGAISATNAKAVQVGALPSASTSGSAGANTGARTSSTSDGFPEVIGNKSSAPTGDVKVAVSSAYTNASGLASVKYGTGDVKVYMNGGTTANVTGATTVTIQDINTTLLKASSSATAAPGTSKLTTVNLQGVTGNVGISSDAITNLSVVDSSTSIITINSNTGANTGALALSVGNSSVTVQAGNATSVAVTGVAAGYAAITATKNPAKSDSTLDLEAAKATTVSFGGTSKITLSSASGDLAAVTSITANGSGDLDLGTPTSFAKLTSVDASASSSAITATLGATITSATTDRAFAFTGGSGKDTVSLSGAMKSGTSSAGASIANTINLGAGDDSLIFATGGSIAAGSSVAGGDGTDTISAALLNGANTAQITGFERLGLDAAGTYDTDLLVGATGLSLLATGQTYTNVEQAQSLYVGKSAGTTTTTLTFTSSNVAGTADAYAVSFDAAGGATSGTIATVNAGVLAIAGIENVTINSGASEGFVDNTISLTATNLKTVAITGAAAKTTLSFTGTTNGTNSSTAGVGGAVTAIDGSAATGAVVINTTGVVADNSTTGLTVTTGAGKDVITLGHAASAKVLTGAGDDTITTTTQKATLTLGDGKDTVNVSTSVVATLVDPVAATEAEATVRLISIVDLAAGDTIDFDTATTAGTATALGTKTSAGTATTLLDALNAFANATGTGVTWGQYGGNTYIVYDAVAAATGISVNDIVIKVTGLVDLSLSTYGGTAGALVIV